MCCTTFSVLESRDNLHGNIYLKKLVAMATNYMAIISIFLPRIEEIGQTL